MLGIVAAAVPSQDIRAEAREESSDAPLVANSEQAMEHQGHILEEEEERVQS